MGLVTLVVLSNLNDFVVFWFYDLKRPWASLCPASNGIRLEKCTYFILRVFRHGLSKPNLNQDHFLWEFLKEIRILLQYFVVFLNMSPASITDWITGKQEVLVLVFFYKSCSIFCSSMYRQHLFTYAAIFLLAIPIWLFKQLCSGGKPGLCALHTAEHTGSISAAVWTITGGLRAISDAGWDDTPPSSLVATLAWVVKPNPGGLGWM